MAAALAVQSGLAAIITYTWDPSNNTTGSDGDGAWDNSATNFATSGADIAYPGTLTTLASTTGNEVNGSNTVVVADTTGIVIGQYIGATRFNAGTTVTAIDTGTNTITLSTNATNNVTADPLQFFDAQNVTFGAGGGTGGTVAVSGTQLADNMTIAANSGTYVFNGGDVNIGNRTHGAVGLLTLNSSATFTGSVEMSGITFGAAGQTLTLTGGSTRFMTGNGNGNINAAGNNSTIAKASSIVFSTSNPGTTTSTYTTAAVGLYNIGDSAVSDLSAAPVSGLQISTGAILNTSGNTFIGYGSNALATVDGGSWNHTATSGLGALVIARGGGTARVILQSGSITNAGTNASVGITVGMDGAGELDVLGGTLTANYLGLSVGNSNSTRTGVLNIAGGTSTIGAINFGTGYSSASTQGSGTLTVTGGSLYVGSGGIVQSGTGSYTATINLSGGTVGASADWSSSMNMGLTTDLTNGNITFKAADAGNVAHNITLSGNLTGLGGLIKTGGGTLLLSGISNGYAGGTTVSAGTLNYGSNFTMSGTNQITVAATGTAGTDYATVISSAGAILTKGGTLVVNFSSSFLSGGESFSLFQTSGGTLAGNFSGVSVTGSYIATLTDGGSGIWTGSDGGFNYTFNNNSGAFSVSAIPEPSTYAVLFGVMALGLAGWRRSRAAQRRS